MCGGGLLRATGGLRNWGDGGIWDRWHCRRSHPLSLFNFKVILGDKRSFSNDDAHSPWGQEACASHSDFTSLGLSSNAKIELSCARLYMGLRFPAT